MTSEFDVWAHQNNLIFSLFWGSHPYLFIHCIEVLCLCLDINDLFLNCIEVLCLCLEKNDLFINCIEVLCLCLEIIQLDMRMTERQHYNQVFFFFSFSLFFVCVFCLFVVKTLSTDSIIWQQLSVPFLTGTDFLPCDASGVPWIRNFCIVLLKSRSWTNIKANTYWMIVCTDMLVHICMLVHTRSHVRVWLEAEGCADWWTNRLTDRLKDWLTDRNTNWQQTDR